MDEVNLKEATIDISEYYLKRRSWLSRFIDKVFNRKNDYGFKIGQVTISVFVNKKGKLDFRPNPTIELDQLGVSLRHRF